MSSSSDDDDDVGPRLPLVKRVRRVVPAGIADSLPSAPMYENSFMHRSPVLWVFASKGFVVTVSLTDVKFWKKAKIGIEFVKTFVCADRGNCIVDCAIHSDTFAVISSDKLLRVFDVGMFSLSAIVKTVESFDKIALVSPNMIAAVAGSTVHLLNILLFDKKEVRSTRIFSLHNFPISHIACANGVCVSVDTNQLIEVWDSETLAPLVGSKLDTDLFLLKKKSEQIKSLCVCGEKFAIYTKEGNIYIFSSKSCMLLKSIDETLDTCLVETRGIDAVDFQRRVAVEKPVENSAQICFINPEILAYTTILGIKFVYLSFNQLICQLGQIEASERFVSICPYLHQTDDPTIIATAAGKERFYLFSKRLPGENRDVFNERVLPTIINNPTTRVPISAPVHSCFILNTTMGDIRITLYPTRAPLAVENFSTLAQRGYYDSVIFHRVIKGFMIQTGDPSGDGTGGDSIWGSEFKDEISLRFDKPFLLGMANCGPNTNKSQFFITTAPTPWLNGKHTIFGAVVEGFDVVHAIENLPVDANDRPEKTDVKILTIRTTEDTSQASV